MKFLLYFICRILKAPMFWVAVPPFNRWKNLPDSIKRDQKFLFFSSIIFANWFFNPWYVALTVTLMFLFLYVGIIVNAKK